MLTVVVAAQLAYCRWIDWDRDDVDYNARMVASRHLLIFRATVLFIIYAAVIAMLQKMVCYSEKATTADVLTCRVKKKFIYTTNVHKCKGYYNSLSSSYCMHSRVDTAEPLKRMQLVTIAT